MDLPLGSVASSVLLFLATLLWAYCDRGHRTATARKPDIAIPATPPPRRRARGAVATRAPRRTRAMWGHWAEQIDHAQQSPRGAQGA
jgi:hypothetical protein